MKTLSRVIAPYLISRLICSLFVYLGHSHRPYLSEVKGGWAGVENWWLNPWTLYDSYWYMKIAVSGYELQSAAFFPLLPSVLKFFGPDQISMALAGIVISHLAFFIALVLIYKLTEIEHNETIAIITIWTICFMPSAAFWGAVYTESIFLALSAGVFLSVRKQHWGACAVLAAAAALVRNPGVLIAIALCIEITRNEYSYKEGWLARWYVPLAPLCAFVAFQAFLAWRFHNPVAGVVSQDYFGRKIMWPWLPLIQDANAIFQSGESLFFYFFTASSLLITLLALIFVVYGYRKIPSSYLFLIGGITLMNLIYARLYAPTTIAQPRYMGALFPFSQLIAITYYKVNSYPIIGPFIVSVQIFIFLIYSYSFGLKIPF